MFFLTTTTKIKARVRKTTIFVVKLDFLNFAQLMKVHDSFCEKRAMFAGWVEFVTFSFKNAGVMEVIE